MSLPSGLRASCGGNEDVPIAAVALMAASNSYSEVMQLPHDREIDANLVGSCPSPGAMPHSLVRSVSIQQAAAIGKCEFSATGRQGVFLV